MFNVESEKDYGKWEKKLKRNPGKNEVSVLNPIKHKFRKTGICGSNGVIEVFLPLLRLSMKNIR